jgi:heme-degrading monooxygenase HmoA
VIQNQNNYSESQRPVIWEIAVWNEGELMKYIFEVRIREGHTAEEYADAWVRASEIIQQAPGARGTELHRKIGDPNVLIAIASWDSKEQRDAMEGQHNPEVARIIRSAAPFCEITPLGEFEDPEWVVMPPGKRGR